MRAWVKLSVVSGAVAALGACAHLPGTRAEICPPATFQVYFEADSSELTNEGLAVISAAAANARSCRIEGVRVVGLADAAGSPQANLVLSQARASAVSRALAANGLPAARFDEAAVGQAGAVTPDGAARPLRRRVDVTLDLAPPR